MSDGIGDCARWLMTIGTPTYRDFKLDESLEEGMIIRCRNSGRTAVVDSEDAGFWSIYLPCCYSGCLHAIEEIQVACTTKWK